MKIAVMGAGGVGGYFGGRLAQAGCDVSFIARGAHLAALRDHGLKIESAAGDAVIPKVQATHDAAEIGPVDLVLFAVKLADTEAAAQQIKPLFGPDTTVVSFQNGVQKDALLRAHFGDSAVMGGVAYISATIRAPGIIHQTGRMARLQFGEFDGSRSVRAEAFLQLCQKGGFDAELATDIRRKIWEKFVLLVGLSAMTTVVRLPIGPIREHPLTRAFLLDLMREAVAVGRAEGVDLPVDCAQACLQRIDGFPAEMMASMTHDLNLGKPLEVNWLSGAVVDLGAASGVATPCNRAIRDLLALHAAGRSD